MSDIFISYASADRERIQPIVQALERQAWSVWWDRKIPLGRTFDDVIEEAIDAAKCIIVVWTKTSVASQWVRTEASEGERRGILIPILLDDVKLPLAFRRVETAQLIDWDGVSDHPELDVLFEAITRIVGKPPIAKADRPAAEKAGKERRETTTAQRERREEKAAKRTPVSSTLDRKMETKPSRTVPIWVWISGVGCIMLALGVGIVSQLPSWGAATPEPLEVPLVATATPSSIPEAEPTQASTDTPEPTVTSTPIPVSPYEGHIIFTSSDDELGILDIAQIELKNVVSVPGIQTRPSVSPDGSRIAFSVYIHETEASIYISDFEGKDIEQLIDFGADANAEDPVWLDNENIIFGSYISEYWDIYLINIHDKELYPFFESTATRTSPRTSPSRSLENMRLAYECSTAEGWNICVSNSDGSDVTRLPFDEVYTHSPSISPDGTKIAFVSGPEGEGEEIYLMDADGGNLQRIIYSTRNEIYASPTWSPDGRYIAYVSLPDDAAEGSKIYIVNSNGNELYQLPFTHSSIIEYISWGP